MRLPGWSETDADRGTDDGSERGLEPASVVVDDVSVGFGDLSVLEDVSLTVEPGEFVGFVGPNGAGKTTLLRTISAALEPDAGTVTVDGVDIHDVSSTRSSRLISVVPQDTTLSFSFPVRDVVEMGRHPHRSRFSGPTAADREAVERALERTRTAELAERPIDEVSGGQRQRVVLARAIAQETPVMLLDEPTGSLDVNHQIETLELVQELVTEGRTVCAAIHDLDLAARYCDRLVMLADGAVYRNGPPADVLTGESLSDVFDATATVTRNPITGAETVTALPNAVGDVNDPETESAARDDGEPDDPIRVHVLGTGSIASAVLARLETAESDLEISVGPVTNGDTAAETARSLGLDRLEVAPFESLSPATLTAFEERVREADVAVVAGDALESTGTGIGTLLESIDESATPVVIAMRPEGGPTETRAGGDAGRVRARGLEATPETILAAVRNALGGESGPIGSAADSSGSGSAADSSDSGSAADSSGSGSSSSGGESTSSDGDSSPGVSAGSSSD